jgi:hypothetical protein
VIERISVEVTNRCHKGCSFCYSSSNPEGESRWTADELVSFAADCARGGVRAMSLGGGEPLQWEPLLDVLARTRGLLFRSMTTNGLGLDEARLDALAAVAPEKIHVSIHFPDRELEVRRAIQRCAAIAARGIKSGVNLLVRRSGLEAARRASAALAAAGIGPERIVYLPMRGQDTPSPEEVARVAGGARFQSMTCLGGCAKSPRFCSIGWDRSVAWCSYTGARRTLAAPTYAALVDAITGRGDEGELGLRFCGDDGALLPLRKASA